MNNEESCESGLCIGGVAVRYEQDPLCSLRDVQAELEKRFANLRPGVGGLNRHRRLLLLAFDLALEMEQALTPDPGWFGEPVKVELGGQMFNIEEAASADEIRNAAKRVSTRIDQVKSRNLAGDSASVALLAAADLYGEFIRSWHSSVQGTAGKSDQGAVVQMEGVIADLECDGRTISGRIHGKNGGEFPFSFSLARYALFEGRVEKRGSITVLNVERFIVSEMNSDQAA
jgi:cell division protein ZapA (FtsZ GTPase activity inhibitor)